MVKKKMMMMVKWQTKWNGNNAIATDDSYDCGNEIVVCKLFKTTKCYYCLLNITIFSLLCVCLLFKEKCSN